MEFKGVENPKVYIIDFDKENTKYPLLGNRGNYLTSLLGSFLLLDKVRVANWNVQGKDLVVKDIVAKKPEVVITLGDDAVKLFLMTKRNSADLSGSVFDISFGLFKTKLLVLQDITTELIADNNFSVKFSKDLYHAAELINGTYRDILKEKEILTAHSFNEFKEIYETRFLNNKKLSYDIETNARPPMMKGSRIIGFSIGNDKSGVYVSQDSLDFHMSKEEEDKIWDYLINEIFKKKEKLIIHNTMYERPYTYYCKNYEIPFEKADDTLVMARMLRNPKESAGLKYQAQTSLGYPDWETDLQRYIKVIYALIGRLGQGPKKFCKLYEHLVEGISVFDLRKTPSYEELKDKDKEEIDKILDTLYSIVADLYTDIEIKALGVLISKKVVEATEQGGIKDSTIPYNWIPDKVLCQYGAVDALSTYDLYLHFNDIMNKDSTDTIDLHKGYENWLEHIYIAYIMERNGMYWDDAHAEKDRQLLVKQSNECMRALLKSPCFKPLIVPVCSERYKPIILSDYLPQIASSQNFSVEYDRSSNSYTVKKDGIKVAKGMLANIEIPEIFTQQYNQVVELLFNEEVDAAKDYDELKEIYNPSSSKQTFVPREILLNSINDKIQMGGRINNLKVLHDSAEFENIKDKLSAIELKLVEMANILSEPKLLQKIYNEKWAEGRKTLFNNFCILYNKFLPKIKDKEIKGILKDKEPVKIDAFDDNGIVAIYNSMIVTGIDQDDKSTWTPEFEWMVNFRIYKKASKIITTYIDGTVGRQSVAIVDKEAVSRGDHCVERIRTYDEGIANNNEDYLLMAKWFPNTAETGRWRSAQHTIPSNSLIKMYYTSRFKGGITLCPDYSQMEVRTLGAVAHDENMLTLFRSGKDFHTETAKKIFRKDEVTPAERKFSKGATFSLLYGSSVESFAKSYCKGDLDYAKMIFKNFFEIYPKVEEWVEARHKEVEDTHRVSLELSNRFIPIVPKNDSVGEHNALLRKAQNYPIQAQSADLTGCVIFDLQKYIEENNLKSLIFMYIHDSIEVDVYPFELLQFVSHMQWLLNESPKRRMGLPSKADVALGKSLGYEIEMTGIEMNEEMTEGTLELEGYKNEIDDTVNVWKEVYDTVEVYDEKYEPVYISMKELFMVKKPYSPTLGTTRYKGSCKVHIKYYK